MGFLYEIISCKSLGLLLLNLVQHFSLRTYLQYLLDMMIRLIKISFSPKKKKKGSIRKIIPITKIGKWKKKQKQENLMKAVYNDDKGAVWCDASCAHATRSGDQGWSKRPFSISISSPRFMSSIHFTNKWDRIFLL